MHVCVFRVPTEPWRTPSGSAVTVRRGWGTAGTPGPGAWPQPQGEPGQLRKSQPPPHSTPPHTQVSSHTHTHRQKVTLSLNWFQVSAGHCHVEFVFHKTLPCFLTLLLFDSWLICVKHSNQISVFLSLNFAMWFLFVCLSGLEKERKVSMRLHRGAPVNISSSDLTGRQDTSRMSSQVTNTENLKILKQECPNSSQRGPQNFQPRIFLILLY